MAKGDDITGELTGDPFLVCTYCHKPCDGTLRDEYGELVLGLSLPICVACALDFDDEPGPWSDWG